MIYEIHAWNPAGKEKSMCTERRNEEMSEESFVSSLLNLPAFKELDGDGQDQDEDGPDVLSIQQTLIDYFLNLPAFREVEEDRKSEE